MFIIKILAQLHRDQRGLAAVEYALLLGLVVLVMVSSLSSLANAVNLTWGHVSSEAETAVQQATGG